MIPGSLRPKNQILYDSFRYRFPHRAGSWIHKEQNRASSVRERAVTASLCDTDTRVTPTPGEEAPRCPICKVRFHPKGKHRTAHCRQAERGMQASWNPPGTFPARYHPHGHPSWRKPLVLLPSSPWSPKDIWMTMGMMLNADRSLLFIPNHQYDHTHPSHLLTHLPSSPSRKRKQKPWPLQSFPAMTALCSHRLSSHADLGSSPVAPTEQTHRDVGCLRPPLVTEGTPPSQRPGDHQPRAAAPDHGQSQQLSLMRIQSHLLCWLVENYRIHCCLLLIWDPVNYSTTFCHPSWLSRIT